MQAAACHHGTGISFILHASRNFFKNAFASAKTP
jgi:hypothetical protein